MVNISIDVTDLGGEARPGDKVVLWKPAAAGSSSHAGRVISTAPVDVFLTNGKASVPDVEPGEMRVLLQCRGVESQGPIDVTVPDGNGTVTLRSLIESQFEYAPPIVSAVQEAAANASASERAAIEAQVRSERAADRAEDRVDDAINNGANLIRNEVKQDADRAVSARQAATQSESNAAASEGAAASSASSAAASESAAKQSETNAGDFAAVATTAATEAVDAMERATDLAGGDFATHEYVDAVGQDVQRIAKSVEPIGVYRDDSFAVIDSLSRVAFKVDADGNTLMGATSFVESTPGFRVLDSDDRVAFEITSDGKTIINDLVGAEGNDPTAVTELHAFICAGQSNMSGRGDPIDPTLDVKNPRLLQYGAKNRTLEPAPAILDMMDTPIGLSPARQFGLRYLADQPEHVGVLLITAAHGGTGFTYEPTPGRKTWTKGHADAPENALYENALQQSQEALSQAEAVGYSVNLQGLLWHQGEANGSSLPQNMQSYAEQLDGLISNFRTDLDVPDLPVVVGEMMPEGMRDSIAKRSIGYMHAATPGRVQRTAFAPAPDNTMRHNDFAHFSREGAILLGDSFFDAWPRAVLNVPTGKPRSARNVTAHRVGDQVTVAWSAPMCRITSYKLEWADSPEGEWQEVSRDYPMNLSEVFTATNSPAWVRVTAYEDSIPATPTNPIPALGA